MVCVKRWAWLIFAIAAMSFLGCAGKEKKPPATAEADAGKAQQTAPSIAAIPNPYLVGDKKIPKEAVSAFNTALVTMQSEEWPLAQQQFQHMTQLYPELSGPWVNLGIAHWRQQQLDEAERAFQQALLTNPLNNDAYVQFAIMQRERGKFAEAEQLYLKALEVWPHNVDALINLGILYDMYMGRFDEALEQFELAQQLIAEPSQELDGWIIDIKRRQSK